MHSKKFEMMVLVYLLVFFCVPSSLGLYKRGTNTLGSVEASVWSVALNQTGISDNVDVTIGDANGRSYTLNVVSNSEVDVVYDVIVRNIPNGVRVKIDNESYAPQNSTVTFSNAGTILYGAQPNGNTHTLTFKADVGTTAINNQTVTIDVDFRQA